MLKKIFFLILPLLIITVTSGCITSNIKLFSDGTDPLREFTLYGSGKEKIVVIPVKGIISMESTGNILHSRLGVVQDTVSQLALAERDRNVKAVILMVNSPGGTVTSSDLLYEEIRRFKERSGIKVVVCMMELATSGGYYISLPADTIIAHPTTLTGSVGVIFMRPEFDGLMNLIGVKVNTGKSGEFKDMGSPFRGATEEEQKLFQEIVMDMASKFTEKVKLHRKLSPAKMEEVATARVYTADGALKAGLIDKVGYVNDAILEAVRLGGMDPSSTRLVVYRRDRFNNDNTYIMETQYDSDKPLMDLGIFGRATSASAGFYYIWPAVIP